MPAPEATVVTYNVLSPSNPNATSFAPQYERLERIANAITGLQPDVVSLLEVEGSIDDNPAADVAGMLDLNNCSFIPYGERPGVGMIVAAGPSFNSSATTKLSYDRTAVTTTDNSGSSVTAFHLSHELLKGLPRRKQQVKEVIEALETSPRAIAMGDMNAQRFQPSRRALKAAGFTSALASVGYPRTFPTSAWKCDMAVPKVAEPFLRTALHIFGGSIDDIYVRGGEVVEAGVFRPEGYDEFSDHFAVHATVRWLPLSEPVVSEVPKDSVLEIAN